MMVCANTIAWFEKKPIYPGQYLAEEMVGELMTHSLVVGS
jgi:hypothetical protein